MSISLLPSHTTLKFWGKIFFLLLVCFGCQPATPQVVKIGLVAPFEGEQRETGYDGIYAARLAVREFNQVLNANNSLYRVALVALDDSGNIDIAAGNAQALAIDPAIVAVVGMGRDSTKLIMAENLARTSIPYLHTGVIPFESTDPATLPADFKQRYEEVTPFDEVAGSEAGPVYDAFQLIWAGIETLEEENRPISAESLAEILNSVKITSITGRPIYWDP